MHATLIDNNGAERAAAKFEGDTFVIHGAPHHDTVSLETRSQSDFARDLLRGFARRPRSIAAKYFYDAAGSMLFDRICALPEYHQTRTELRILQRNLDPDEALAFLRLALRMLRGGGLLIGVDLVKDPARLHAAYNDAQGVTAAFNLNVLRRANRELGANFDIDAFGHYAPYDPMHRRIEMHLVSRREQSVRIGETQFDFAEGDTIHTENSYKFTLEDFRALASRAGFHPGPVWLDNERLFSVHWLCAPRAR